MAHRQKSWPPTNVGQKSPVLATLWVLAMVQVFIPFPHQVPKGPQTNLTVNPLQMLAGRVQYLPPLEGSTDKGYCKLFTFYKCQPWILGAPFLGHWDSGYLGSKVQGPRIREHKDRFQANCSTPVREGAKFKNSQMVVKKVKWTYFDVKWYKK